MKETSDFKGIRAAVVTISDSCAAGERRDESGLFLQKALKRAGASVLKKDIIPDIRSVIAARLRFFSDESGADLVLTTGGTGLGSRDVTPEATRQVIEKEVEGIAELMRREGGRKTRRACLSRAVAGVRRGTLIINLPGSLKGASESFAAIREVIPHACAMIRGEGHEKNRRKKEEGRRD